MGPLQQQAAATCALKTGFTGGHLQAAPPSLRLLQARAMLPSAGTYLFDLCCMPWQPYALPSTPTTLFKTTAGTLSSSLSSKTLHHFSATFVSFPCCTHLGTHTFPQDVSRQPQFCFAFLGHCLAHHPTCIHFMQSGFLSHRTAGRTLSRTPLVSAFSGCPRHAGPRAYLAHFPRSRLRAPPKLRAAGRGTPSHLFISRRLSSAACCHPPR